MTKFVAGVLVATGLGLGGSFAAQAQEGGDAAAGERVFRKCMACHAVGEGAEAKVGPVLNGVVGRPAAAMEEFTYSDPLMEKAEEGLVWDAASLDSWLENPKELVPGNKMIFPGLRQEQQRADVIAYLATFAEDGTTSGEGS